jgi:Carboxypeptidase regulatory-like domain
MLVIVPAIAAAVGLAIVGITRAPAEKATVVPTATARATAKVSVAPATTTTTATTVPTQVAGTLPTANRVPTTTSAPTVRAPHPPASKVANTTTTTTPAPAPVGPTTVYNNVYGTLSITSTVVAPAHSDQLCPGDPTTGAPLGGAGRPGAQIHGHLTDYQGNPIPDVCVALSWVTQVFAQETTDAQGNWQYQFPGFGSHGMVWFTYTDCPGAPTTWGFPPMFFTMYVFDSGPTVTIDAQAKRGSNVEGTAVDGAGNPVPGATITLNDQDGPYSTIADGSGHFSFTGLATMPIDLDATATVAGVDLHGLSSPQLQVGVTTVVELTLEP